MLFLGYAEGRGMIGVYIDGDRPKAGTVIDSILS